jgi:hypothetical protein
MITSEYKGESDEELVNAFYEIYKHNLEEGLLTVEECEWDLEILEEEEQYLGCAGIFKAINNYKAIKDKEFSELLMEITPKTE